MTEKFKVAIEFRLFELIFPSVWFLYTTTSPFWFWTWENPDFSRRKGTRDFPSTSSPFVFTRKTPTRA